MSGTGSDETPEKLLFVATHGSDDAERATFPFVLAAAAATMGVEAVIVLQGAAVTLAMKEVANHVFEPSLPPLAELLDFILEDEMGKVLVCAPCLKERHLDRDLLVEGVEVVAAGRVVLEALEARAVLNY